MKKNKKIQRENKTSNSPPTKKLKISNNSFIEIKTDKSTKNEISNPINFDSSKNKKMPAQLSFEEQSLNINTIKKLHELALKKYNQLISQEDLSYKTILNEILDKLYDLDEKINELFLKKLRSYYLENKKVIDKGKDGESDNISSLFFKYIFTLDFKKRIEISDNFKFFKHNEIFLPEDKKYFYYDSIENIFKNFIKELFEISSTIEIETNVKTEEEYKAELKALYQKYEFPNSSYKIPIKFGNKELMYINFILQFRTIFCINSENIYECKFNEFELPLRFLALNYFKEYLIKEQYDILSLQYIIFSINTLFIFRDVEADLMKENIKNKMFECSRFLYQSFEEKKKYLIELKEYIKNKIKIEDIDEEYLKNNLLKIEYNNKKIEINGNNCYFLGNKKTYLNELINNNVYSFEYLRSLKFPLFIDKKINDDFKNYVKLFLQSNLTNEYINSLINIPEFNNIVFTDEIIDEINENTIWVKFPVEGLQGLSDRNIYTIFLNNNIENSQSNKLVCILSSKLVTNVHEDSNHILRLLLNINNYNILKTTPKNNDKIYKIDFYNEIMLKHNDQGDMWEHILFGEKLTKFFILGSLSILDTDNLKLKINEFKNEFQKNNKKASINLINEILDSLRKNKENFLIKYINKFEENNKQKDFWLEDEQYIVARNSKNINFLNDQFIYL